jgi:hypothetical protein
MTYTSGNKKGLGISKEKTNGSGKKIIASPIQKIIFRNRDLA